MHKQNFDKKQIGAIRIQFVILMVIIVLGSLTILLAYFSAAGLARDRQRLTDIGQIDQALQIFLNENGFYPYGTSVQVPVGMDNYLDRWPSAPASDGSCSMLQNEYLYSQKSNGTDFTLSFCLGQETNGIVAGSHTLTKQGI